MKRDVLFTLQDCLFTWDPDKAEANLKKHGVSFEQACEVFFDPFYEMDDSSVEGEERWAFFGYSRDGTRLCVVAVERSEAAWRIITARKLTAQERHRYEEEDGSH